MKVTKIIVSAAAAAMVSSSAWAVTWDMPTPYPDATFHTVNVHKFAEDVKAATGGKLEIKVHSAGSLFKHPEIKNAVRGGQVPIGEFFLSLLANENAVFGVDSVPFLATDYDQAKKLWAASRGEIDKLLDKQGLMILYAVPWPPQGLYTKKEINGIDDLKGLKFRANNPATTRLADLAGMVPTQIEVPDIPQAFATGRVDAMITSPSTGANSKSWDYLSNFYHTQAWLPKNVIVVNKRAFRKLDDDVQKAVLDAAAKAETRGWNMSMAETDAKIKILKDNGMKVFDPSPELKAGLKAIGDKMTAEWAEQSGEVGAAILKAYGM
jgi:TRAP-type C4-dicarboxylate transport system substrate-binding protein